MRKDLARRWRSLQRKLAGGMDPHEAAVDLLHLTSAIAEALYSTRRGARELTQLLDEVMAARSEVRGEALDDVAQSRAERARSAVSAPTPRWSGSAAMDAAGDRDADAALRSAAAHLAQLARQVREVLTAKGDTVSPELQDLALSLEPASALVRMAQVEAQWSRSASRRSDVGHAAAHVGRCAAEALRAEATAPAPAVGVPVEDVAPALLWLIADLSVALRRTGRIGPHALRHDAGVGARDSADAVVTTFRRWRPRLRGGDAEAVAAAAVTAAYAAAWAGLATIVPTDADAAGVHATLIPRPPDFERAAMAESPAGQDPHPVDVSAAESTRIA